MKRIAGAAGVAAFAASVLAGGSAQAAYAPRLEARLDPPTPSTPAALTVTRRQAPGEDPNRTEVIRYPRAFKFNPGFSVTGCTRQQEDAAACPEPSRIGQAVADTELGRFEGPVYLTDDLRTIVFLRGFGGLVQSKVEGHFRVTADGSVETVVDDLPPVRATFAEVRLEAGPRSLILSPAECGSFVLHGTYTSHFDEVARPEATVRIEGCDTRPRIAGLGAKASGRAVVASWTLTEAGGFARVTLERRVALRPWVRWRRIRAARAAAHAGPNNTRLGLGSSRRVGGRYRVRLIAYSAQGRAADLRTHEFRLPPRSARR